MKNNSRRKSAACIWCSSTSLSTYLSTARLMFTPLCHKHSKTKHSVIDLETNCIWGYRLNAHNLSDVIFNCSRVVTWFADEHCASPSNFSGTSRLPCKTRDVILYHIRLRNHKHTQCADVVEKPIVAPYILETEYKSFW